jgi:hypothetical protein
MLVSDRFLALSVRFSGAVDQSQWCRSYRFSFGFGAGPSGRLYRREPGHPGGEPRHIRVATVTLTLERRAKSSGYGASNAESVRFCRQVNDG